MKQFLVCVSLALCLQATAGERKEQQLLDAAARVLCTNAPSKMLRDCGRPNLRIVQRREAVTIVASDEGGFALMSNDDRQRPVLGYSREGRFNPDELPCSLQWYLQSLDISLKSQLPDGGSTSAVIRPGNGVKPQVDPLIDTDWYQGTPFNDWCPTYVDGKGNLRHYALDCSNTATMQIMYYHHCPDVGCGETAYTYESDVDGQTVSVACRFDTVRFEWDKMAVHYDKRRSSDEAANEVAARVGIAICTASKMHYKREGSLMGYGKHRALMNYFGYSPDIQVIYRNNYDDNLWMHIVFDELSCGRPVYYHGTTPTGGIGHAFIIDGYDADGLVHINWGWGNNSYYDGYFDINILMPNDFDEGFSTIQEMMVYIRPEGQPLSMTQLTVSTPGTLASLLGDYPQHTRLKISGQLNADDLETLKQLGQRVIGSNGQIVRELTHLDLSEATVPGDTLAESAFESCSALLDVVLPNSLRAIGERAFLDCRSLVHIGMPSGLRAIGQFAFLNCLELRGIVIPRSVETIGNSAFSACIANDAFTVESGSQHFATIDGMLTNAAMNRLVAFPCKRSGVEIPAQIDSIGSFAFRYCVYLKEVRIPSNVKVVSDYAFMNCRMNSVSVSEGVERILNGAFYNCDSLTAIHLPASIDSIGRRLFVECDNLQQVTMADTNPNFCVENNCLLSRDKRLLVQAMLTEAETVDIPACVDSLAEFSLYWMNIKRLTLPATLRSIGRQSVFSCKQLSQLDISEGLETIESYAFNGCSALTSVHLPASLKTIGYGIFINCTDLHHVDISEASPLFRSDNNMLFTKDGTQLLRQFTDDKQEYTVPSTVTAIGQGCFRYLRNMRKLTIPENVTSIGNYVLYGYDAVSDVFCLAPTPIHISRYVFDLTDLSRATLHVPTGCRQLWMEATGWSQFGTIVDDLPTAIGEMEMQRNPHSRWYDLLGRSIRLPRKGINIVRDGDGTLKVYY